MEGAILIEIEHLLRVIGGINGSSLGSINSNITLNASKSSGCSSIHFSKSIRAIFFSF